jgi:hypothetical protein
MEDEFSKRRREELERIARLADPLREMRAARALMDPMREARELMDPMREARELMDPMRWARELMDPMREARELMDPMREARQLMEPMREARQLLEPICGSRELMDPMKQAREQLEAARLEPMLRAKEELRALTEDPMLKAREQLEAARLEPMRRAQEELRALTERPMFNAREQIAAMFRDPVEQFREQIKAITDPLAGFRDTMAQQAADYQKQLREILDPFHGARDWLKAYQEEQREQFQQWRSLLEDFSRQMAEMPARLRAQLAVLMQRGWCLDPEMPHTWGEDLVEAIKGGEEEEAQQWLIGYFRKRLDEIEQALVKRHPQRAELIAAAFAAHREGRYALSIPVLLAQADGVIHDKHRRQLFSKKSSANLKGVLDNLPDDDTRAIFMAAFYVDIPLTQNTNKLPASFDGLNRHAVLHGTDPSYGTEVNSLRAVSLLNMASFFVTEEEDDAAAA